MGSIWAMPWLRFTRRTRVPLLAATMILVGSMVGVVGSVAASKGGGITDAFPNPLGIGQTMSTTSSDANNAFFQSLGTNGRACVTCHQPSAGMSITPTQLQALFVATNGLDPLFHTNDGSTSPNADVSTVMARQAAYSLLLQKGLIRIGIGIPAGAEFTLDQVDDPYGYASSKELSLFRRPLPATNLRFLSAVMWDGRETLPGQSMTSNLLDQANTATLGHAQASQSLTLAQASQIVTFETGLYTAQVADSSGRKLQGQSVGGDPLKALSQQPFFLGINDPLGLNPTGAAFTPVASTTFAGWQNVQGNNPDTAARLSIARGETLFNTRQFAISGVRGLNDNPQVNQVVIRGTCTTCHNTPNVGNHSVALPLDLGLTDASRRTPDLPLYTLRCTSGALQGQVFQTTDPGRALITGKCSDIGKFKGPVLRGLATRPPYFHNGSAATLADVVNMYNGRFTIGLTDAEKADIVAFLSAQ